MLRAIYITTFLFTQLLHATSSNAASGSEKLNRALDRIVRQELEQSGTPSLQVAVANGHQIVYRGTFGYADLENKSLASHRTRYRTASVAKWFTATLAFRLHEQGKLDLDAPIRNYCLPFYEVTADKNASDRTSASEKLSITSRQLLTHTAGIRGYIDFADKISTAPDEKEKLHWQLRQIKTELAMVRPVNNVIEPIAHFRDDPLDFTPGTDWQYTSFGYRLLSCVLQGAATQEFSDLMSSQVFAPAQMAHTEADDARKIISSRAAGYELGRSQPTRRAKYRDVSDNLAAGGYLSTATDLVKFAAAFNDALISDKSKTAMLQSATEANVNWEKSWRDAIPTEAKYAHGIMLFSNYRAGLIGHTGRQDGGSAILVLSPDEQLSIAVMTNAKGWNGYLRIVSAIFHELDQHAN